MEEKPLKIAIVGTGVAGLTAAYILQRKHNITLFEKTAQVGGHTNTIVIPSGPEKWTPVDAGFTYLNDLNYPLFRRLLEKLQVPTRPSRLSFAFWDEKSGFHYALTGLNGVFAQRSNLWNGAFLRMLQEISRFKSRAAKDLFTGALGDRTLGDYLSDGNYSKTFIEDYLLPLGSAIWTLSVRDVREIPAQALIGRMETNGLLGGGHKIHWLTVADGSHNYVRALIKAIAGRIRVKEGVEELVRKGEQVQLRLQGGKEESFDKVVLA
ncbi:MAG TPA: FAD-dependent oxidoreductase, partial [bacterium]|nr:FAD-dependent oxidoreductase [bacterium]